MGLNSRNNALHRSWKYHTTTRATDYTGLRKERSHFDPEHDARKKRTEPLPCQSVAGFNVDGLRDGAES